MKKSRYNIFVDLEEQLLAFNSKTLALLEFDRDFFNKFNNNDINEEEKNILLEMGFLIKDDNELEYLEYIYNKKKFSKDSLNLTIKLTNDCNLRCKYCYQEHKKNKLSMNDTDTLIKFIKKQLEEYKSVNIHWFGGEPLLNINPLLKVEEFLVSNNIKGNSDITSNGYLLNQKIMNNLKKTRISSFQITLDGEKNQHDILRITSSNKGTFDRIIENIKLLIKNKIYVDLRININNKNRNLIELLKFINKLDKEKQFLSIYGNELTNFELSENIEGLYFKNLKEYSEAYLNFQEDFFKLKMFFPRPTNVNIGCEFETDSCFMVETDLKLYFCTSSDNNDCFCQGEILSNGEIKLNMENYIKKISESPFKNVKCRECKLLPMCMGGCTLKRISGQESCIPEKYNLEQYIKLLYKEAISK